MYYLVSFQACCLPLLAYYFLPIWAVAYLMLLLILKKSATWWIMHFIVSGFLFYIRSSYREHLALINIRDLFEKFTCHIKLLVSRLPANAGKKKPFSFKFSAGVLVNFWDSLNCRWIIWNHVVFLWKPLQMFLKYIKTFFFFLSSCQSTLYVRHTPKHTLN